MADIKEILRNIREEVAKTLRDWSPSVDKRDECVPAGLLSVREAAGYLDVAEATLCDWRVDCKGPPAIKYGRLVKYRLEDLEHWTQGRRS